MHHQMLNFLVHFTVSEVFDGLTVSSVDLCMKDLRKTITTVVIYTNVSAVFNSCCVTPASRQHSASVLFSYHKETK